MTMTEYHPEIDSGANHGGAPGSLGSGPGAPPRRARRPASILNDGQVRELVAAACEDQIAMLGASTADENSTQRAGRLYVIAQLDEAVNELRNQA